MAVFGALFLPRGDWRPQIFTCFLNFDTLLKNFYNGFGCATGLV
jgi:hypothetical protein